MVGGIQGEEWKFIQKYLKKNIQKCRSQLSGSFRRTPVHCAKWLRNSRNKRLILQPCKNLPSAWSDLLEIAVTPPFQLRIAHRLKHWIFDFLSFEMIYSMQKMDLGKSPKVHKKTVVAVLCFLHSVFPLSVVLSLHTLNDFGKGLWSSKAWFFMNLSFPLLCHEFQRTLLNIGLLW